jgi:hypothetical protein
MANNITAIIPTILAKGLLALRKNAVMPRLVNGDYSADAAKFGSVITVPVPVPNTASAVTPSNIPPAPTAQTIPTVPVALNSWEKTNFFLTDQDLSNIDKNQSYFPMSASEAIIGLAQKLNLDLLNLYVNSFGFSGTPATTPFQIGTGNFPNAPTDATNVRKILGQQLCPSQNRRFVLDPNAEANALALPAFSTFLNTDDTGVIMEGELGRKFGFDFYMDQDIPFHTSGTITTGLSAQASTAQPVGTTAILATTAASTGACALVVGDIITFAGDSQTYVVTAAATQASAASAVTVNIYPGKLIALAGGEAISVKASHQVNLAFHRDAFAMAIRPIEDSVFKGGSEFGQMTDPQTGISLALEVSRQYKQTVWEFSILYGVACVRPELTCRLAG